MFRAVAVVLMFVPAASGAAEDSALISAGKQEFIRCAGCHALSATAEAKMGPHLAGIVGRRAAAVDGFPYSEALRAEELIWTEATLDQWLENPRTVAPGMCISFLGLPDPYVRKALIAYLKNPDGE